MASRRTSRDIQANAVLDLSDSEIFGSTINYTENACPKTQPRKLQHPACTNFSLDTLSAHLQKKLKESKLREDKLKSDPQYASAEAEREKLRRLVNSKGAIHGSVRNGKLEVWPAPARTGRRHSAPASEGDTESKLPRRRAISGLGSSNDRVDAILKSWNTRRTRSIMKEKDATLTNHSPSLTQVSSSRVKRPEPSHRRLDARRGVPPTSSSRTTFQGDATSEEAGTRTARYVASITLAAALSRQNEEDTNPSMDSDNNDSVYFDTISDLAVNQQQVDTAKSMEEALGDISNLTNSTNIQDPNLMRSLSFERHADGVRQATRSPKGKGRAKDESKTHENNLRPTDEESPRPRKAAGGYISILNPIPFPLQRGEPSNIDARSLNSSRSATNSLVRSRIEEDTIAEDLASNNRIGAHKSPTDELQLSSTSQRSSESISPPSTIDDVTEDPEESFQSRLRLRGNDTFYSMSSSDDNVSARCESDIPDSGNIEVDESSDLSKSEEHDYIESKFYGLSQFDYGSVVPEKLPSNIIQARENCRKIWSLVGLDDEGHPDTDQSTLWYTSQYTLQELNPDGENILGAANRFGQFPREWEAKGLPVTSKDPPICSTELQSQGFPEEILPMVCLYLSSNDVRNLRLVNRATSVVVLPIMIRSTVINFGGTLSKSSEVNAHDSKSDIPTSLSLLKAYGSEINKFGIAFDFDESGLANAEAKTIESEVNAWFGKYSWPKETYPRFQQLKELEDLVDSNRPLLKSTMKSLNNVSELAISVDSGHGWLNGPDISDLAVLRKRQEGGSKVFGRTFDAPDKWQDFALREFFRWGQQNTINACAKDFAKKRGGLTKADKKYLRRLRVRNYDDYRIQSDQPDFNRSAHTGGTAIPPVQQPGGAQQAAAAANPVAQPAPVATQAVQFLAMQAVWQAPLHAMLGAGPPPVPPAGPLNPLIVNMPLPPHPHPHPRHRTRWMNDGETSSAAIIPQWPLLFNCYNIAGQVGGGQSFVRDEVFQPPSFPYMPGELTETQVQWLMETIWAQRAFLSAYTNSLIANSDVFKNVHSLHIAKLSSGLIPSIDQKDFWTSLPNLKRLTLMISPDWRQEHVPGDRYYQRNMLVSPMNASVKLAMLLKSFITKIESLSVLRTGFVGGGEHQTGIFGRNRHVLPAPITIDPRTWLTDHEVKPNLDTMFAFNHVRKLVFENCWFSPCMLEAFMKKSRDTSLHHLVLDSVSLTGCHDTRNDGPLTTEGHSLRCEFSPSEWLQETVPNAACWVDILDKITPGKTIIERKYDAQMMDEEAEPRPEPSFRGNVKQITLNSCGYVRIMGPRSEKFCQNGLVEQSRPWNSFDEGLEARKRQFYVNRDQNSSSQNPESPQFGPGYRPSYIGRLSGDESKDAPKMCIMMNSRDPEFRNEPFGLGKLTQCVHPVEKRILERAWNMRFGWGDTMERWGAVEDGWYEGGTGRFSGTIVRDDEN